MESDFAAVKEVSGINLDNYFPHQSSFNTVIYVHKRFLKKPQKESKKKEIANCKQKTKKRIDREDKAVNCDIKDNKSKKGRNDSVLQQTIKFAKNLVPLVIPPSEGDNTPVFYTIKSCRKCKKKGHQEGKCEKPDDATFEKKRSKKLIEMYKKEKKNNRESYSVGYSVTHSSQSTLDDINTNQSLCCTFSDQSVKNEKHHKSAISNKTKRHDFDKFRISESFEGLATELNNTGETKIKIHLMNEKEKHFLTESIRKPVLEAITDCLKQFDSEMKEDVKSVQRFVKCNSQKLDSILNKLTCIENHLASTNSRTPRKLSPKLKILKASRLEQLGEDLMEGKEYSSEEELPQEDSKRNETSVLVHANRKSDFRCGEIPESKVSTSVGVRTERHRLPARFCWTDAERKNEL